MKTERANVVRAALIGVTSVCVAATAACASGATTGITNGGGGGAAAVSGAALGPTKPLSAYLLQASDVPDGFVQQQLPPGFGTFTGSVIDATKQATITPKSCQPDLTGLSASDADASPKALFTNGSAGTTVVTSVNPSTSTTVSFIDQFRRFNLGDCASYEVASTVAGQSFTATQKTTEVDVDVPGVSGALTVEQQTVTELPGVPPRETAQYLGLIPVPGGTITIAVGDLARGSNPDEDVFRQVVAAAAKKVTG